MPLHKDAVLDNLARRGNVAQFVAFRPDARNPRQSFCRIAGHEPNELFLDPRHAVDALLAASSEGRVNVRSYLPDEPRSREFVYGLATVDEAMAVLQRLTSEGLHTIVNETVDVSDGGVSGVVQGETIEFAPDDTPRCVEKPGVVSLPFGYGVALLNTVYGFTPELEAHAGERTEFSIHPRPRGWKHKHTLIWEHETDIESATSAHMRWPNRFSRMIGDKAFGLLMADRLGVTVPRTLVIARRLAPFTFGRATGSAQIWTRTCPTEPHPGLFTTVKGWTDPFALLQSEDPDGKKLASVLRQDAVNAGHSGAAIVNANSELVIEGRRGEGDRLMLGLDKPEELPTNVVDEVRSVHRRLSATLGPVRFEWVHDGACAWVVQLHLGATSSAGSILVPGEADKWIRFGIDQGLAALRRTLDDLPEGTGLVLVGEVGLTSHVADLVRKAGAPARMAVGR